MLRRERPIITGLPTGAPLVADGQDTIFAATRAVLGLQRSMLFIQGPPGTGKTYAASRLIVALIKAGRRVGVTSNSHEASQ